MAKNPYQSYSSYQLDNAPPAEQIAALFSKAAEHMATAGETIKLHDVAGRYEASQKATTILEGLLSSLNRDTPERAKVAAELETYYKTMITLISRMNVYNDSKICTSLENGFKDMANFWREAGQVYSAKQQADESIPLEANLKA